MGGEVAFVDLTECVHLGLQSCDSIGVVRVLYGSQENAASSAIIVIVMEVHFGLKPEVEEVGLGEEEDIIIVCPHQEYQLG